MPPITGCYINLARAPDRAAFMQAQLARLGMDWVRRAPAVDGAGIAMPPGCSLLPGEYACYLSHLQAVQAAPPDAFLLVLEDDMQLSDQLPEMLDRVVQGPPPAFDIALLECQPQLTPAHASLLWDTAARHFVGSSRWISGVGLLDARDCFKWGNAAYLVPPAGRARLLALLHEGLAEGPVMPVDDVLARGFRSGQLRGAVTVPFLATTGLQWHGRSTIGNGMRVPGDPLMVLRRLLFAGELGGVEALTRSFAHVELDPALRMLSVVLRDIAADQRREAQRRGPVESSAPGPAANPGR